MLVRVRAAPSLQKRGTLGKTLDLSRRAELLPPYHTRSIGNWVVFASSIPSPNSSLKMRKHICARPALLTYRFSTNMEIGANPLTESITQIKSLRVAGNWQFAFRSPIGPRPLCVCTLTAYTWNSSWAAVCVCVKWRCLCFDLSHSSLIKRKLCVWFLHETRTQQSVEFYTFTMTNAGVPNALSFGRFKPALACNFEPARLICGNLSNPKSVCTSRPLHSRTRSVQRCTLLMVGKLHHI